MANGETNPTNPFAQFSPEDQASIREQFLALQGHEGLNPAQRQSVARALGYLEPSVIGSTVGGAGEDQAGEDFLKQHTDQRLLREYGLPELGEKEVPPGTLVPPVPRSQFVEPTVTPLQKIAAKVGSLIPEIHEGAPSPVPPQRGTPSFAYTKYGSGPPFASAENLEKEISAPLLPVGRLVREQIQRIPDEPSRWALHTVLDLGQLSADTVEGLSTPVNVGLLTALAAAPEAGAGLWVKRLTALGFSGEMARQSADKLTSGFAKAKRGEYRAAGQDFASSVVGASFSVAAGLGIRGRTPGLGEPKAELRPAEQPATPPEQAPGLRPPEEPMTPGPEALPAPAQGTPQKLPGRVIGFDADTNLPIIKREVAPAGPLVEGPGSVGPERRIVDRATRLEVQEFMRVSGETDPQLALEAVRESQAARVQADAENARLQREAEAAAQPPAVETAVPPVRPETEAGAIAPAVPEAPTEARLQIREGAYRGKNGFSIVGRDTRGRSVSVFTESRPSAEHIKAKLASGGEISPEDFQAATPAAPEVEVPELPLAPGERVSKRTGFTKSQQQFLAARLEKVAPELPLYEGAPGGEPATIRVPGDGEFTIPNRTAANALHRAVIGEPLPGMPEPKSYPKLPMAVSRPGPIEARTDVERALELYGTPFEAIRQLEAQKAAVEADPESYPGLDTWRIENTIEGLKGMHGQVAEPVTEAGRRAVQTLEPEVPAEVSGLLKSGDVANLVQIYNAPEGPKFHVSREYAKKLSALGVIRTGIKYRDTLAVELTDKGKRIVEDYLGTSGEKAKPKAPQLPMTAGMEAKPTPGTEEAPSLVPEVPPKPTTEAGFINLAPIADALRSFIDETLKPVDIQKGIIRENAADLALKSERFEHAVKSEIKRWGGKSADESLDFMDRMEKGQPQTNPQDQALANTLRKALDDRRDAIIGLGTGRLQHWIENYWPHIWEKGYQDIFAKIFSKRTLGGPASFLKHRTIPTTKEGVDAGLKPVTWNPVELAMLKIHEMDRYLMGQKIIGEMKSRGLAKFVRVTTKGPEGWLPINDRVGVVYGPPRVAIKEAFDEKVMDALQQVADGLGIKHEREVAIGGKRWGYAEKGGGVVTKFAGPESVLTHEIGHQLDWKYSLAEQLVKNPQFKKELRALADLRFEGQEPTQAFQRYVRKGGEKMAAMIQGYIHAPERFQATAPNTYRWLTDFLRGHEELKPLLSIKPSLVLAEGRATVSTGGITIRGRYWSPKEVANVLNRYLSPGLQGNRLYDFYRGAANTLNQAQLGMSAFHLMFTSMDASISDYALAIEQATSGQLGKAILPAMRATSLVGSPLNTYLKGNRLLKECLEPGRYAQYSELADALVAGGGRIRMDRFYKNSAVASFWNAWKGGDWTTAVRQFVPAVLEECAKPLMEHLVPRQKLGVFVGLAEKELARLGPKATREQVRAALGKVWDSVDNRMGQLVYDNLFWNRAVKDLGMASARSLGWNIGTLREIGGGLVDWAKVPLRVLAGQKPEVTHRMAYTLALPIIVGWAGAVLQALYTGQTPSELKDYFFPKTGAVGPDGRPERVSIASYMRDVYAVSHHPVQTIGHKIHPMVASLIDMLENKDFYGVEVRHADDPLVKQLGDVAAYAAEQFLPFSARYYQQRRETGESRAKSVGSFFGITPSPAYIRRSKFENAMRDYLDTTMPEGPRTREQARITNRLADYRRKLALKQMTAGDLAGEVRRGSLTREQSARIQRQVKAGPLVSDFRRLPVDEAVRLWPLASRSEQQTLALVLREKIARAQIPAERKRELFNAVGKTASVPSLPFMEQ